MKRSPQTSLSELDWIPPAKVAPLERLGLKSLEDLVKHFPRRHEDRIRFDQFPDGDSSTAICLLGTIVKTASRRYGGWRRGFEATIESSDGLMGQRIICRWFNAFYVQKMLATGMRIVLFGKTKRKGKNLYMDHPEFELVEDDSEKSIHFNRITPVHPAGEGVTARTLRGWIFRALEESDLSAVTSLLPEIEEDFSYPEALKELHFPSSWEVLTEVRPRLVLEEFFALQLLVAARREQVRLTSGFVKKSSGKLWQSLLKNLPFELTPDQKRVIEEISHDLAEPHPMQRLLQGDVGSGKTLVALAAALHTIEGGFQAALMAPTQILAEQHYLNFQHLLEPLGIRIALLSGNNKRTNNDLPLFDGDGPTQLFVGTHALLFEGAEFEKLGLVVIDEQHKFGVMQRTKLLERGDAPDLLVMTATPIPRTLTQTVYGDLDVSVLREKPLNRGRIITAVRPVSKLKDITKFLFAELTAGRQAFIVYPLVDESEKLQLKAATEEFDRWTTSLAPHRVGLIHGRMKREEKEAIMQELRENKLQALVATTVVEVGVDIPNANIMLIENAERFGLAQLHQLRGRVGRGAHKSYCILVHSSKAPEEAISKLEILEQSDDGFKIAEADLELRGPGDLAGTAQTGLP
ncbi:MAG: ATP-dependent DNA helicase RecG, partial [Chthoniobacterales bacterium]